MSARIVPRPRGDPLYFLIAIIVAWIFARLVAMGDVDPILSGPTLANASGATAPNSIVEHHQSSAVKWDIPAPAARLAQWQSVRQTLPAGREQSGSVLRQATVFVRDQPVARPPATLSAGERFPLPPSGTSEAYGDEPALVPMAPMGRGPRFARFSGDGWVLWRSGAGGLSAGGAAPAYGASQAGGVLRFAFASESGHAPHLFTRVSRALSGATQNEIAAGVAARPLPAVPLRLAVEARVQRGSSATLVRPAASLITEVSPQPLPFAFEGEVYGQLGYVGGEGATPFFDGQVSIERPLVTVGAIELRAGAGAWAGGQDGASRLDLGPRLTLRSRQSGIASRVTLDWRFRTAGAARPGSGPAVTISGGF